MSSRRDFLYSCAGAIVGAHYASPQLFELQQTLAVSPTVNIGAPREATAEGTQANLDAVDALMENFMLNEGVSAGQLAVFRGGKLLLNHSYATKPPRGYEKVTSESLFRVASCSKMFTCAAITTLHSRGDLDLDAKVFPYLGINTPAMHKDEPDPRTGEITVQHLVDHAGGWNDHESVVAMDGTHVPGMQRDPMFGVREIALDLKLDRPPSKLEIAQYMYGKKLQFAPGSQDFKSTYKKSYSNLGYMLLGLVIEKSTGRPYIDFIKSGFGPDTDTTNVYLSRLLDKAKNPREVWYVCPTTEPSALKPRSNDMVSSAYGGGYIPELHDSAGGLMTNAATLATFSSHHAVWGLGGRAPHSSRSGSLPGTTSMTYSRPNGVDAAFIMNTREFRGGAKKLEEYTAELQGMLDQV